MKKYIIIFYVFSVFNFILAEDIQTRICRAYSDAGFERYNKNYPKAKHLEQKLNSLMMLYTFISISSCPKKYQKYGIYAKPRYPDSSSIKNKIILR